MSEAWPRTTEAIALPDGGFVVDDLTPADGLAICSWRYPTPYDFYDAGAEAMEDYVDPTKDYHAVRAEDGTLAGFCCFGVEARVPGWPYGEDALDVGLGMRPDLTGRGLGAPFVEAVLAYRPATRLTVAAFNIRAIRVYQRCGFAEVGRFDAATGEFVVMRRLPREARGDTQARAPVRGCDRGR